MSISLRHRRLRCVMNVTNEFRHRCTVQKPFLCTHIEKIRLHGTAGFQISCNSTTHLYGNHPHPHRQVNHLGTSTPLEHPHACVKDTALVWGFTLLHNHRQLGYGRPHQSKRRLIAPHLISDTSDRTSERSQNKIRTYVESLWLRCNRKRLLVQPFTVKSNCILPTMFRW